MKYVRWILLYKAYDLTIFFHGNHAKNQHTCSYSATSINSNAIVPISHLLVTHSACHAPSILRISQRIKLQSAWKEDLHTAIASTSCAKDRKNCACSKSRDRRHSAIIHRQCLHLFSRHTLAMELMTRAGKQTIPPYWRNHTVLRECLRTNPYRLYSINRVQPAVTSATLCVAAVKLPMCASSVRPAHPLTLGLQPTCSTICTLLDVAVLQYSP